ETAGESSTCGRDRPAFARARLRDARISRASGSTGRHRGPNCRECRVAGPSLVLAGESDIVRCPMSERANALGEFMVTYHVETDRAAGILVGVGLEGRLENLLISYLADWEDLRERVFAENRPLGTLSAKIDLVFALGLLSAEHRKVLD